MRDSKRVNFLEINKWGVLIRSGGCNKIKQLISGGSLFGTWKYGFVLEMFKQHIQSHSYIPNTWHRNIKCWVWSRPSSFLLPRTQSGFSKTRVYSIKINCSKYHFGIKFNITTVFSCLFVWLPAHWQNFMSFVKCNDNLYLRWTSLLNPWNLEMKPRQQK